MREILFRAKRIDNGKWVEGTPYQEYVEFWKEWEWFIQTKHPLTNVPYMHLEIDRKTICEFTGLTDKNGKKIFEGDILKFSDCGIYPVWWDADFFTFGSCWFSDFDPLYKYDRNKIEVIGNIHDNPELLENP